MADSKKKCPYADDSSIESSEAIWASCPAFSSSQCPFASCNSPEEIKQRMLDMPESHVTSEEISESFSHYLQGFHQNKTGASCPVAATLNLSSLDGFSMSEIMAGLLVQKEEQLFLNLKLPPLRQKPKKSQSLSQSFQTGTAAAHEAAEAVHFVKSFIAGNIHRERYAELVESLYFVYKTLESALDSNSAALKSFAGLHESLRRTPALELDMEFWHGEKLPATPTSEACRDYMDRLKYLQAHDPILLLAHAYTRYLGDLSGGKILARVAKRALDLQKDGLEFYAFPNIKSAKLFKDEYRKALDNLNLDGKTVQKLVREANIAFLLNIRIFEELDVRSNIPHSRVRSLEDVYNISVKHNNTDAECPFLVKKSSSPGRCPWPFIVLHDPQAALADWQTWVVLGLVLCWLYGKFVVA